jgi:nicotinamide-nucleotide amidase
LRSTAAAAGRHLSKNKGPVRPDLGYTAVNFFQAAMNTLLPLAARIAAQLKARNETIAIAESSAGGLISAALLAVPGASAYFLGGAVVYTGRARATLLQFPASAMEGLRASTEPYALLLARTVRERHAATWGLAESGAAGPTGNRYGDAAGHVCIAVAGPAEFSVTVETGRADRPENMRAFAALAPCKANTMSCETGADCCGGFCRETSRSADGMPVLQCVPPPVNTCSNTFELCTSAADCCNPVNQCINGRCSQVIQ